MHVCVYNSKWLLVCVFVCVCVCVLDVFSLLCLCVRVCMYGFSTTSCILYLSIFCLFIDYLFAYVSVSFICFF